MDEPPQVGGVGHEGEQPVDAELVEVGQPAGPVDLAADVHGGEGLLVGPRQLGGGGDEPRDPGGEGAPPAAAVAAHDPDELAHRAQDGLGVGRVVDRQQHDDLLAEAGHGDRGVAGPDGLGPGAHEAVLEGAHLVGRAGGLGVVLVGLGDDDDEGAVDVPAEGGRVRGGLGGVAGPSGEGVAEELGAVLALDRRDRLVLGDGQRGDGGGPLEHVDVGAAEGRAGGEGAEHPEVGGAGDDADEGAGGVGATGRGRASPPARPRR